MWISLCLAALVLCGCGGSGSANGTAMTASSGGTAQYDGTWNAAGEPGAPAPTEDRAEGTPEAKRIYTADLNLETRAFDDAVAGLTALVERSGGWFQDSSVGDYGSGYRHGSYTVRLPAEKFQTFLTQVGELCHVTWQSSSCEDVSEYYYDTAGRLKTQQTKLERLQALLARAEAMEDIITIETAISETEQQIDSLSGELGHYDSLVNYSTVRLTLDEVYRLSDTEAPASGFGARLAAALASGWKGFVSGLQNLLIALAYGWVWLAILAAVAAVTVPWALRRHKRRSAPRKDGTPEKPDDKSGGL